MSDGGTSIGRRIREIRSWRGTTLRATAELAGLSESHLSRIERGERPVERRSTLEALAAALRVAPSELTGSAPRTADAQGGPAHEGLVRIEAAIDATELGEDPGGPLRDWPAVAADVTRLADLMSLRADYEAIGELAPDLIRELHAAYVRLPDHRRDVLVGLLYCANATCWTGKRLGARGLPQLAGRLAQHYAEELDHPAWRGYATWLRGGAAGELSRAQHYRRAVAMADELAPAMDDAHVAQAAGMLHLSAALAAAAQTDTPTATTHLDEAEAIAGRSGEEVGTFGRMWFGTANVGIWRVSMATELGEGGKVAELAGAVRVEAVPAPSRRAEFHADLGRALMRDTPTREAGLRELLRAEQLAPQRIRNDVFVRETVVDHLMRARRDAGGRELRGLAHRIGLIA